MQVLNLSTPKNLEHAVATLTADLHIAQTKLSQKQLQHKQYISNLEARLCQETNYRLSLVKKLNSLVSLPLSSSVETLVQRIQDIAKIGSINDMHSKMKLDDMNEQIIKLRLAYESYREKVAPAVATLPKLATQPKGQTASELNFETLRIPQKTRRLEISATVNTSIVNTSQSPVVKQDMHAHTSTTSAPESRKQSIQQLNQLKQSRNRLQLELQKALSKEAAYTKRYRQVQSRLVRLQTELQQSNIKVQALEITNASLSSQSRQNAIETSVAATSSREVAELRQQVNNLRKQQEAKQQAMKTQYQHKIQSKQHEIDKLNMKHQESLANTNTHHKHVVQQLQTKHKEAIQGLKKLNNTLQQELLQANNKIEKLKTEHQQQMGEMTGQIQAFIQEQSRNIDTLNSEFAAKLRAQELQHMQEVQSLKTALDRTQQQTQNINLEEDIHKVRMELGMHVEKLTQGYEEQIEALNHEIKDYKNKLKHHAENQHIQQQHISKLQAALQDNKTTIEELEQKLQQSKVVPQDLSVPRQEKDDGEVQSLRQQLIHKQQNIHDLNRKINQLEGKLERPQQIKIQQTSPQVTELEQKIRQLQSEYQAVVNDFTERFEFQQGQAEKNSAHALNLESQLEQTQTTLQDRLQEINSLTASLTSKQAKIAELQKSQAQNKENVLALEKLVADLTEKVAKSESAAVEIQRLKSVITALNNQLESTKLDLENRKHNTETPNEKQSGSENVGELQAFKEQISRLKSTQAQLRKQNVKINRLKYSLLEDMCKEIILELLPSIHSTAPPVASKIVPTAPGASLIPDTKAKPVKPKAKKVLNFDVSLEDN